MNWLLIKRYAICWLLAAAFCIAVIISGPKGLDLGGWVLVTLFASLVTATFYLIDQENYRM